MQSIISKFFCGKEVEATTSELSLREFPEVSKIPDNAVAPNNLSDAFLAEKRSTSQNGKP